MTRRTSAHAVLRFCAVIAALSASATVLPVQADTVNGGPVVRNVVATPLIVQTRGGVRITSAMLSSMSKKAGEALMVPQNIGTGTYLVRPARPTTAQGLHSLATRLATHPNILGARLYQQAAPAYVVAPAGHQVVLHGATLAGSTSPVTSYQWHQILGPTTGTANSTQPNLAFLAKQSTSPGTASSDPAAINPGDLSALPQTFDCAISVASVRKAAVNAPVAVSKNDFMCNPGSSGSLPPTATSTPPDSGTPSTDAPSPGSGTPSNPPSDTGTPASGTPLPDQGTPGSSTPPDTAVPPAGSDNLPPTTGQPPSGGNTGNGLSLCNGNCNNAVLVTGGVCNGNCNNAKFNGTGPGNGVCIGNCNNASGGVCRGNCNNASGGLCNGNCSNISGNSIRTGRIRANASQATNVIGYRLIATDKAGVAHVRNIYVRVNPLAPAPAAAATRPKSPLTASVFTVKPVKPLVKSAPAQMTKSVQPLRNLLGKRL